MPLRRFAALVAVLALPFTPTAHAELLDNVGLEPPFHPIAIDPAWPGVSGPVADGWLDLSRFSGNEDVEVAYGVEVAAPYSGFTAQRIEVQDGVVQLVQYLPLQAEKVYRASVWLRAAAPMTISVLLREVDPPFSSYMRASFEVTTSWEQYELAGVTGQSAGLLVVLIDSPGTVWVDEASLTDEDLSLPLPSAQIDSDLFGIHIHSMFSPWPYPSMNVSGVRIWDASGFDAAAHWSGINTAPGVYDWSQLDPHVDRALQNDGDIIFVLGRTPRWASARPDEPSAYGLGEAAEPSDIQHWRDWVAAVGTRYQGQIQHWEIWNEPDALPFFSGSIEAMLALASDAYTILKSIDPSNQVILPSPSDLDYLNDYLASGGGSYADIIGYHFSVIGHEPEVLYTSYIPTAQVILEDLGLDALPLWNTEAGWWMPPALPDEVAVGYVARSYILNWARGVERLHFYSWDTQVGPRGIDLSDPPDYEMLTPAGVAYQEVSSWLLDTRMLDLWTADGTWFLVLGRANGTLAYVIWNPDVDPSNPIEFDVPPEWGIQAWRDLAGTITESPVATVPIDSRPVLLEQEAIIGIAEQDVAAPSSSLFLTSPNPGFGVVELGFRLATPADVSLSVYDSLGRHVADLGSQRYDAGTHSMRWDGADRNGAPAASGVYFVRIESAALTTTRKITLVR